METTPAQAQEKELEYPKLKLVTPYGALTLTVYPQGTDAPGTDGSDRPWSNLAATVAELRGTVTINRVPIKVSYGPLYYGVVRQPEGKALRFGRTYFRRADDPSRELDYNAGYMRVLHNALPRLAQELLEAHPEKVREAAEVAYRKALRAASDEVIAASAALAKARDAEASAGRALVAFLDRHP